MHRSRILKFLLICMPALPLVAEFQFEEIMFVPWEQGEEFGVVLRDTPGGPFGPESFASNDGTMVILDSQGNRALFYEGSDEPRIDPLPIHHPRDLILDGSTIKYLLQDDKVYRQENGQWNMYWSNPRLDRPINRLESDSQGGVLVIRNMEHAMKLNGYTAANLQRTGLLGSNGEHVEVVMKPGNRAGLIMDETELAEFTAPGLASIQYLGSSQNAHYVLLEVIEQQIPLKVSREIRVVDETGSEFARITGLKSAYTLMSREFIIEKNGDILHMLPLEDGVHLLRWIFDGGVPADPQQLRYPKTFEFEPKSGDSGWEIDSQHESFDSPHLGKAMNYPDVTPAEALAIGDSYVTHQWTAAANNLTNGLITDPSGNQVQTPSWVTVGSHVKLPYKWGGFNTVAGFDDGLASGKYAGDRNTADVSSYAVSVDCSGFVSRCWKLPYQYSTRMMDAANPYIFPLGSWEDMRPGDAIHKVGHVRLFVDKNSNGTYLVVESTSREWRVSYYSYSLSELSNYWPRYYINMQGRENMPAAIPQPVMSAGLGDDELSISWSLNDTSTVKGFHIYGRNELTGSDWEVVNQDIIPVNEREFTISTADPSAWSYQVTAVNHEGYESHPTDSYTYANKGSSDKLLIVDGYDRWAGRQHEFARIFGVELAKYNYSFITVDNDAVLSGLVNLEDYPAVFWLLGEESTADESFNDSEQDLVENYLKQGGKLFVTGSEIAWDLDYKGSIADKSFLHNFLKVKYELDDSESYTVRGVSGTAFEGLDLQFDNGSHGIYEVGYPDTYTLTGGSQAVLRYATNRIAAASFQGVSPGGTVSSQVMMMGFPFETMYQADDRSGFVHALLDHFQLSTALSTEETPITAEAFKLHPAYPNPFNPSTTISFDLREYTNVALKILDLRGREVVTLLTAIQDAGTYSLQWDGSDRFGSLVSTGVYFAQLQVGMEIETTKLLYLR